MLTLPRSLFPVACFLALIASPGYPAPGEGPVLDNYVALAIQGDLTGVTRLLDQAAKQGDPAAVFLQNEFNSRFVEGNDTMIAGITDPFVASVADEFRSYWRSGLLGQESSARNHLESRLNDLLFTSEGRDLDDDTVFGTLARRLSEAGILHYQNAEPPFLDLFLWLKQSSRRYTVRLTDQSIPLTVHFMEHVVLQGWKDYASLGLASTSGWVDEGELYCLDDAYDRSTERFEVSFLKHEARHLADLDRFPRMGSTELEYRAKLTELAFANRSVKQVLEDFSGKAAQNTESPHAMANWRVVRDVYRAVHGEKMPVGFTGWDRVIPGEINRAARELLSANSKRHESRRQTN